MTVLEGKSLVKSYGSFQVLKGVDVQVEKGEVVAVVGASGAGKSTLLHVLGTLDRPDAGEVLLGGDPVVGIDARSLSAFRNKNIGFVFQFHNLLPEFDALENVMIPGMIAGMPRPALEQRASGLLERLGLSGRIHHKPSELSGGEQQRVAVARALVNQPLIVLADEPSGNLDSANARELHKLFFDLRTEMGQTFVIVTHNAELAAMSDRIIELKDGLVHK